MHGPERQWLFPGNGLNPGKYTLRGTWTLFGCTKLDENSGCTAPRDATKITSNELTVNSPEPQNVAPVSVEFEVRTSSKSVPRRSPVDGRPDTTLANSWVANKAFRYVIRNVGPDPIRTFHLDCGDNWIAPQYETAVGEWKPLPVVPGPFDSCTLNAGHDQPLLPGQAMEGAFSLATLNSTYSTAEFLAPGQQKVRFILRLDICVASADASFCITTPTRDKQFLSNDIDLLPPDGSKQ